MTTNQLRAIPLVIRPTAWESMMIRCTDKGIRLEALAIAKVKASLPVIRYTHNGGIRFLKLGRLQFSFSISSKKG